MNFQKFPGEIWKIYKELYMISKGKGLQGSFSKAMQSRCFILILLCNDCNKW